MSFATMLAIAATVWGGQPACGPAQVEWYETVQDPATGQLLGGYATPEDCRMRLSLTMWRAGYKRQENCDLVVHEFGHLRGLGHHDPGMESGHRFRACWSKLPERLDPSASHRVEPKCRQFRHLAKCTGRS